MKKIQKKLVLKKKTIAQLSENAVSPDKLDDINGGCTCTCCTCCCYCCCGGGGGEVIFADNARGEESEGNNKKCLS